MLFRSKTKDSSGASVNTDGLLGYGVGVLKEFRSKAAPVGYEFGVFYLQRKPGRYGSYSESSNWISVPFLARRHLGRFSGGLGAYVAHGYGNVTTERGGVKTVAPLSETLNDLDFGPQFGFGFKIYKDVWVELRYSYGIPNLAKTAGGEVRFRQLDFLLGFKL